MRAWSWKIYLASWISMASSFKNSKIKLDLCTDINMLLIVKKELEEEYVLYLSICKANNKCMKDYDKNNELSYIQYWDVNNFYGWAMLQKVPVNNFEWIKGTSQFNENFVKVCNEESYEGYFVEADVQYLIKLYELKKIWASKQFLLNRMKIEKVRNLAANLHVKN